MDEKMVPKWQRELRSFLGIKSGIILEGNVYDDSPIFSYDGGIAEYEDTDDLEQAIISLVDTRTASAVFFDPLDGFYSYDENDLELIENICKGYRLKRGTRNHGVRTCFMPSAKDGEGNGREGSAHIWASQIIRRCMTDSFGLSPDRGVVFVLNFASRLEVFDQEDTMFLNLMQATTTSQTNSMFTNSLVMVVDKYNDIPAWYYVNNPNIHTISIGFPDRATRRLYLSNVRQHLTPFSILSSEHYDVGKRFVAETEGMRLFEMRQILQLAYKKDLKPDDIDLAFRMYKYGVIDNPWENLENDILAHIHTRLEDRVKGQEEALRKVKSVVTRAVKGLSGLQHSASSHKPKGILFMAGPTGVGKTETAKALAESIFGDENACIRFDMSEYRLEQSDQKLFGAPPGYVGYEGGGQLTNAIKNRPFSVLLFDEIEKASPTILDKFLQILEDGRMTDNQGETVYFGETLIIFTSNIGLTREIADPGDFLGTSRRRVPTIEIEDPEKEDTLQFRESVTQVLTEGVQSYFQNIGRPELLNRIGEDNIVIFQFINLHDAEAICQSKLEKICSSIKQQKNMDIQYEPALEWLKHKAVLERTNGGRGVGNMLEREFLNPLATFICECQTPPPVVRCHTDDNRLVFEVMLSED